MTILLAAIMKCIEDEREIEGVGPDGLSSTDRAVLVHSLQELLFKQNKKCGNDMAPRLFAKEQSGARLCEVVLDISPTTQSDGRYKATKNIDSALALYMRHVADLCSESVGEGKKYSDKNAFYENLIEVIRSRAEFCIIHCDGSMNEFQVFESLNGRGMNLTAVDRIRNLFMASAKKAGMLQTNAWDSFSSKLDNDDSKTMHFFLSYFFYKDIKRIGRVELAKRFGQFVGSGEGFSEKYNSLVKAADTYGKLRNADVRDEGLEAILSEISALCQDQIYVPLFAAAMTYGLGNEMFPEIARALLVYIVRYGVCGNPSNALDNIFVGMIRYMRGGIEKEDGTSSDPADAADFLSYVASKQEDDKKFEACFSEYRTENSSLARYFLGKIELKLREIEHDKNPLGAKQSLEHIIPQKIDYADWYGVDREPSDAVKASYKEDVIDCIGNMALLEKCDNSSANNKNYLAKQKVYREGKNGENNGHPIATYKLISCLLEQYPEKFEENEVVERGKSFGPMAVEIWQKTIADA